MSDQQLAEALRCLRLDPGASLLDVERAYRSLKEVYAQGSLASYALLDAEQRQEKLRQLDAAYQVLHQHLGLPRHHAVEVPTDEDFDLPLSAETPGEELRNLRERRGLSISEVGVRTKISPMTLENIEKQRFDRLPAAVYLRGFLQLYLDALGATAEMPLIERYLEAYALDQG